MKRPTCIILSAMVILASAACRSTRTDSSNGHEPPSESVFIDEPVQYCWQKPIQPKHGKVQILIDSSGSMTGFRKIVPSLTDWMQHAASRLQDSSMLIDELRLCQFSQQYSGEGGIAGCTTSDHFASSYNPAGNTNLHEAIRSSRNYDLTMIVTDGVAATGTSGSGDCAGGVDAACVARALEQAVHAPPGEDCGIWVFPIAASYDGTFFTEEPLPPSDFNPQDSVERVRSDMGVDTVIENPHTGSDGRLSFHYTGPRLMLLIVISRWTDMGRAAVMALWDRAEMLGLHRADQLHGATSRISLLPPVELYPGFLNTVRWNRLQEVESQGTIQASLSPGDRKSTVTMDCYRESEAEGDYTLTGSTETAGKAAGCVPIRILTALDFRFRANKPEDEESLKEILKSYDRQGSYTELRLRLACSARGGRTTIPCQWVADVNYAKTADCLVSSDCRSSGHQLISGLSTVSPSKDPHRIYALADILRFFYQEVANDRRCIVLGGLEFGNR